MSGHVDGVGTVARFAPVADDPHGSWHLAIDAPPALARYIAAKGSIAVDGVSLTIFACRAGRFTVALIPHTLARTTLGTRRPGDGVNLEADVLLKHIAKMLETRRRAG
jgi:riboflavin synthase